MGSNGTQPKSSKYTSIQACASTSRTTKPRSVRTPVAKPVTIRDGTPAIRSSSAAAPAKCWQ